jgi:hypothetical protein
MNQACCLESKAAASKLTSACSPTTGWSLSSLLSPADVWFNSDSTFSTWHYKPVQSNTVPQTPQLHNPSTSAGTLYPAQHAGMDPGNFTNLSWDQDNHEHDPSVANPQGRSEDGAPQNKNGRSGSTSLQAGRNADDLDLAGVGNATLECTVTQPMKENDGTKDAYISYLVTTNVCFPLRSIEARTDSCRRTFRPSQSRQPPSADASQISCFCTRR